MNKQETLERLSELIADISNTEPIDFVLLDELTQREAMIQTATPEEFLIEGHTQWLEGVLARVDRQ